MLLFTQPKVLLAFSAARVHSHVQLAARTPSIFSTEPHLAKQSPACITASSSSFLGACPGPSEWQPCAQECLLVSLQPLQFDIICRLAQSALHCLFQVANKDVKQDLSSARPL